MKIYDLIGIGIGPSNLSTAALLRPFNEEVSCIFFDRESEFKWYPGMLFPNAKMQVSFLKDLVTMVDPSNPYSFLKFLKETGRLYMFAAKGMSHTIKRIEFEQYFRWVIGQLSNLHFSSTVQNVNYANELYEVQVNNTIYFARNISIGAGMSAKIPDFCKPLLGDQVVHSTQFLTSGIKTKDMKVIVVGGGQSAVEIILSLLKEEKRQPIKIDWICSSYNLLPLEDSSFSNELYTPKYSEYFIDLNKSIKAKLIEKQKNTSDGVSNCSLTELYEVLYDFRFNENKKLLNFHFHSYLTGLEKEDEKLKVSVYLKDQNETIEMYSDTVLMCTGLTNERPKCLKGVEDLLIFEGELFDVDANFAIKTTQPLKGNIFIHNGAKHIRGVADLNLSLLAWRSAIIINKIIGRKVYDVEVDLSAIDRSYSTNKLKY